MYLGAKMLTNKAQSTQPMWLVPVVAVVASSAAAAAVVVVVRICRMQTGQTVLQFHECQLHREVVATSDLLDSLLGISGTIRGFMPASALTNQAYHPRDNYACYSKTCCHQRLAESYIESVLS